MAALKQSIEKPGSGEAKKAAGASGREEGRAGAEERSGEEASPERIGGARSGASSGR